MLPCLFLTFSRGAWLVGLPAAMLFLGAMKGRQVALAMLAAVVIGVLLLIPLAGTDRIASLLNPQEGTSFIRLSLWQSAVAMIRDHPLQGVGLDQFLYHYPTYMLEAAAQEPNLSHPHNILLDYWTRLGIAGVLTIIWFIASYFQRSRKLYHRLPRAQRILVLGLMAGMVYMIAHGLVDNAYFVTELAFIFAVHTGCVSQLGRRKEEN
jgi:O-antigen ligase